ncbi:MAG: hypothetical protein JWL87_634 [Candidatus Adlerbacteria bacterium]|nr:hypothetical protein [Candidatus Adlerbacteria bacterium]
MITSTFAGLALLAAAYSTHVPMPVVELEDLLQLPVSEEVQQPSYKGPYAEYCEIHADDKEVCD